MSDGLVPFVYGLILGAALAYIAVFIWNVHCYSEEIRKRGEQRDFKLEIKKEILEELRKEKP